MTAATVRSDPNARQGDAGTTIPLILGFFLVALMFTSAAIAMADVFTKQRELQSICDGAAAAAANSADPQAMHGAGVGGTATAIPLSDVQGAVKRYLARDSGRAGIDASASPTPGRDTVDLYCRRRITPPLAAAFGRKQGIEQTARSVARGALTP
jgi:hypothetical protein